MFRSSGLYLDASVRTSVGNLPRPLSSSTGVDSDARSGSIEKEATLKREHKDSSNGVSYALRSLLKRRCEGFISISQASRKLPTDRNVLGVPFFFFRFLLCGLSSGSIVREN